MNLSLWKTTMFIAKIHYKWQFPIVMLVTTRDQRLHPNSQGPASEITSRVKMMANHETQRRYNSAVAAGRICCGRRNPQAAA